MHHAAYYPLEVLNQSHVQDLYVLVDRLNFPQAKAYSNYDTERQALKEENKGAYLLPVYHKYRGDQDPFEYHR